MPCHYLFSLRPLSFLAQSSTYKMKILATWPFYGLCCRILPIENLMQKPKIHQSNFNWSEPKNVWTHVGMINYIIDFVVSSQAIEHSSWGRKHAHSWDKDVFSIFFHMKYLKILKICKVVVDMLFEPHGACADSRNVNLRSKNYWCQLYVFYPGFTNPSSDIIYVYHVFALHIVLSSFAAHINGESLFCWQYGRGDHGRLGYGRKVTTGHPMELPINLPPLSSSRDGRWQAKYVACGGRHTLAIAEWTEATDWSRR